MARAIVLTACMTLASACGSSATPQPGMGGAGSSAAGSTAAGSPGAGNPGAGGSDSSGAGASSAGAPHFAGAGGAPPKATGAPGVWEEVTSPEMDPALFSGSNFGIGSIVADPNHPTDMYVGGYGSLWKSNDYGLTWSKINSNPVPPSLPLGHVLAVAGTTPPTLWMANANGAQHVFKSTDGGLTFKLTGTIDGGGDVASLYSIVVDPHDANHLITGLHEQDKVLESTDAGETWHFVSGAGWSGGGKSCFPFFIDTRDAATTAKTWFSIGQDGGSAQITVDGGKNWAQPKGLEGLQHPHGGGALYQTGQTLFVTGINGTVGSGVYRSLDLGANWKQVDSNQGAIVWGSTKMLYAMWGWACGGCGVKEGGPQYRTAAQPGDTWQKATVPDGLTWGPNSIATTSDGTHTIFVGSMWATGLWRYVEP
jgi:hypothetical protein